VECVLTLTLKVPFAVVVRAYSLDAKDHACEWPAEITDKLWKMSDIVAVLEDWETQKI